MHDSCAFWYKLYLHNSKDGFLPENITKSERPRAAYPVTENLVAANFALILANLNLYSILDLVTYS